MADENLMNDVESEMLDNQVLITGITWDTRKGHTYHGSKVSYDDLPDQFTLNIPENVLKQASKSGNTYNDVIETFVYNFLTHKYGVEVSFCQIWLPPEVK